MNANKSGYKTGYGSERVTTVDMLLGWITDKVVNIIIF